MKSFRSEFLIRFRSLQCMYFSFYLFLKSVYEKIHGALYLCFVGMESNISNIVKTNHS